MISSFINENKLGSGFADVARQHFMPLSEEIRLHHKSASNTYFVGVNGSQGSGKSTLSAFIQAYLGQTYGLNVVVMSLDDFYYSQIDRAIIAADVHPLFSTRGVPGTHNMMLAKSVLNALKSQKHTMIPRFNKATDNPYAQSQWTKIDTTVDIVIFEGWCWGVAAQSEQQLQKPVNLFEQNHDPEGIWRKHANMQLVLQYQPLYSFMQKWVMLKAPSFDDVYTWRLEQEQKLAATIGTQDNHGVMNEQQVLNFIQYYQRLTEHGLKTLPQRCDHVFSLNKDRKIDSHQTKDTHV